MKPNKLLFGTAGIPLSTPIPNTLNGITHLSTLNLDGMELEFVRSVNVGEELAKQIKKTAIHQNKLLTCHGQYYINLSSLEKPKINASKERILNAANIANLSGAWSLTFHAGFYQKQNPHNVYNTIKTGLKEIRKNLTNNSNDIWIRPETTGKSTQFGTLHEILKLSQDVEKVMPCIDFSHLHARHGQNNTIKEFQDNLNLVEKYLGNEGLKNLHAHLSGIDYGDKGEKKHLPLQKSDMNYIDLLKVLKEFNTKGIIICESPIIEEDAQLLKNTYNNI